MGDTTQRRNPFPDHSGQPWPMVGRAILRVPFTLTMLALTAAAAIVPALVLGSQSALHPIMATGLRVLHGHGTWWTPLSSAVFSDNPWQLAVGLLAVAALVGAAELLMGTWRTVLAYLVTAYIGVFAGAGLQVLFGWHNQFWAGQVPVGGVMDATRPALGAIVAASAFAGVMWRRRIRALALVVAVVFILFAGDPAGLYRLAAVLAGLMLGWMLRPSTPLVSWTRSSHHEIRVLAASTMAIIALGPLIAVFTSARFGLLAPMAVLTTGELLPDAGDPRCNVLDLTPACQRAFALQPMSGDMFVGVAVVVALLLLIAYHLLRGSRRALWTAVAVNGAFAVWAAVYYGLLPSSAYPVAAVHLHPQYWRTATAITASILAPAAVAVCLFLLRRHFGVVGERGGWRRMRALMHPRAVMPQRAVADPAVAPRERARSLVRAGGGALAHMATWDGNRYWFDPAGTTGIAYRVVGPIALTVGGPFGEARDFPAAAARFARDCDDRGWHPVFYSAAEELVPLFTGMGFKTLVVAEEAVIDLPEWTLAGNRRKDVRAAVNRAARTGLTAVWTTYAALSLRERSQIAEISEAWVANKNLPEMSFTLGGLAELDDPAVRLMLAVSAQGRIEAVTSWMPIHTGGVLTGWTLDFMRRRPDAPSGVMEFLIAAVAEQGKSDGLAELSLSGAPLARTDPAGAATALDGALRALSRLLEPHYGFTSLMRFKKKFRPRHRSLIMAYPDPSRLGQVGVALARAYLPTLSLRQTLRLMRPASRLQPSPAGIPDRTAPAPARGLAARA